MHATTGMQAIKKPKVSVDPLVAPGGHLLSRVASMGRSQVQSTIHSSQVTDLKPTKEKIQKTWFNQLDFDHVSKKKTGSKLPVLSRET